MPKYKVYGVVVGTKYIGEFETHNKEEAEQLAWDSENAYISICYHCSKEIDEPQIEKMIVEKEED